MEAELERMEAQERELDDLIERAREYFILTMV